MARAMKDSGIDWIGKIPEDWEMTRMKSCISERDGGSWGEEPTGGEGDVICLRIADFDYSKFKFKDVDDISELTKRNYNIDIINKLALKKNDIVIEKSGGGEKTPVGRTVIFDKEYTALYANFCDRLRCREIVSPNFMQYVFVTFYANRFVWNYIKQTTGIQNLDLTSMLSKEYIYTPHRKEQQKIANFLDSKCSAIDAVIEKTKASIEEYKKLKQAIITQAVTKGIRPNRKMKDSGIEWIGEIPEEWNVVKITRIFDYTHPYPFGDGDHGLIKTDDYLDKGIPFIRVQNLGWGTELNLDNLVYISEENNNRIINSTLRPNDILFAKTGATIGKTAIVPESLKISNTTSHVGKITVNKKYYARFFFYLLSSFVGYKQFWDIANMKTTRPELAIDEMKEIRVLIPQYEEQRDISIYLDGKCKELECLITKKESELNDMYDLKKSLIYEYVTGKKEVV